MSLALTAFATDQGVKVDLLMAKITASLKADKAVEALPYFAELESMESSLSKPLPESFHFYYIDTLNKSGDKAKALSRANIYLTKFGKKGKNYGKVIEIMSVLQIQADKDTAEANRIAQKRAETMAIYAEAQSHYETNMRNCYDEYSRYKDSLSTKTENARMECVDYGPYREYLACSKYPDDRQAMKLLRTYNSLESELNKANYSEWCGNRYTAPQKPE